MARINLDDDLFTDYRFYRLTVMLGDEDKAIGAYVRVLRTAQKYYLNLKTQRMIPLEVWKTQWLSDAVIEVGLAKPMGEFIYFEGAEKTFAWLMQRQNAGKKARWREPKERYTDEYNNVALWSQTDGQAEQKNESRKSPDIEFQEQYSLVPNIESHQLNKGIIDNDRQRSPAGPVFLKKKSNVKDSSCINPSSFFLPSLNLKNPNTHTPHTQGDLVRQTLDDAPRILEGSVCGGKDLISNRKKEITSVQRFENYWLQNSPPIDIPSGESLWGMISQGVKNKWLEVYPLEFLEATTNKAYLHYSVLNEHKRPRNMGDWIEKLSSWFSNRIEQYRRQSPHKKTPDERAKEIAELEALRIVPRSVN